MWDGGDVWIIGGGPSVTAQFNIPDNVVQSVLSGASPLSVYSPYMEYLHDKHVIAINAAYLLGDWVDMVFFGDSGFYLTHKIQLAQFPGLKVSCHAGLSGEKWVKFLSRDGKKPKGISSSPTMVSWNQNSGAASISIAAWAGAKRIILLGFDMKLSGENRQHFHNVYGRGVIDTKDQRKIRRLPFNRHLMGFPAIASDAKGLGIEILNACPDSAIDCLRKVTVKDIIDGKC